MTHDPIYPALITEALKTVRYPGNGKNLVENDMIEDDIRIIFRVQTRMTRYVTNERREIVQGHRRNEIFELKTWELCRSSSIKTEAPPELDDTPCPSCGGPVNTYASAICPRCGTAVRMERYEWIVSSIE